MNSDEYFMQRALDLAHLGRFTTDPNPNVGCVIVADKKIVGQGFHQKVGEPHAEVNALKTAGNQASGATAYVTLEPCSHYGRTPPCVDALIQAGIKRAVIAIQDPNPQVSGQGVYALRKAGIQVDIGVLAKEAEAINKGFLKRMRTGLPYVCLKLAASLDGKTAMASGESQWITSTQAREDVQAFRAQSSAILTTSSTIIADDPALNVRWLELDDEIQAMYPDHLLRQPLKIILDRQARVTQSHQITQLPGELYLVNSNDQQRKQLNHTIAAIKYIQIPEKHKQLDLMALMIELGKLNLNSIWVEAGPTLAGSLLTQNLVDELIVYLAPKLLGNQAKGLCEMPNINSLAEAPNFVFKDIKQIGSDLRLRLLPLSKKDGVEF